MKTKLALLLIIAIVITAGIFVVNQNLKTQNVSTSSSANEIKPDNGNQSNPNLPFQVITSIPQAKIANPNPSALSSDECQAQGGSCLYDLNCGELGMTKIAECNEMRPANGLPVDCCRK